MKAGELEFQGSIIGSNAITGSGDAGGDIIISSGIGAAGATAAVGIESGAILDAAISASEEDFEPADDGRLNDAGQGWVSTFNGGEWWKVDLGSVTTIAVSQIQGRRDGSQWITTYQIDYSDDDGAGGWTLYNSGEVLSGNTAGAEQIITNNLIPFSARYVRILPITVENANFIGGRFEFREATGAVNDGAICITDVVNSPPSVTTNKLYSVAGALTWDGGVLSTGVSRNTPFGIIGTATGSSNISILEFRESGDSTVQSTIGQTVNGSNVTDVINHQTNGTVRIGTDNGTATGCMEFLAGGVTVGNLDEVRLRLQSELDIVMEEKADHTSTTTAGWGQIWVRSDTPNALIFTDDAGTDHDLTAGGGLFSEDGDDNIIGGTGAGAALTGGSGLDNFLGGVSAGAAITTGDKNIAIGNLALDAVTTQSNSVAIGYDAAGRSTGNNCTAIGVNAGRAMQGGTANTALGNGAMGAAAGTVFSGASNTALGADAMSGVAMTTANLNNVIGAVMTALTTGANNTVVGNQSSTRLTTASFSTTIGSFAGNSITTGSYSVAIGTEALGDSSGSLIGDHNIAIGRQAMHSSSLGDADDNIAIGYRSLDALTTGDNNIALGQDALGAMSSADQNISIGWLSSSDITTGANNVVIGTFAGRGITTSSTNTVVGYLAMGNASGALVSPAADNTAIGQGAMNSSALGEAGQNTSIGAASLNSISTGDDNVALGYNAGSNITTGSSNVLLGHTAGPTANQSDRLYIHNGQSNTPLIGGDFSALEVTINGDLEVTGAVVSTIAALANSATPSVADGKVWLTGGTTTITDFTGGVTGQEIILMSEHAITITDGTNMFLSGSANFVMASTDSLYLIQKADGNWYEISRSVN